jgi:16S rRNA processing protein RimM
MTTIGKIQKTFGAHGELLLALYGDFSLSQSAPLLINIDGLSVPFYLKSVEEKGSKYIVVFDDMESEKLAQELVGKEVMAELSARQQRKHASSSDGGATLDELIGYKAVDVTSGEVGSVKNWLDYPGNPCLQILNAAGQEIIIPANGDLIVSIDKKEQILTVDLPQGLLEIYLSED